MNIFKSIFNKLTNKEKHESINSNCFSVKKTDEKPLCSCKAKEASIPVFISDEKIKNIKTITVLGVGCDSCHKQLENVKTAVKELNLNIDVMYITDLQKIMTFGVMSMPAVVVNDKVIAMGKVLDVNNIKKLLCSCV